jgi:cytochrome c biogenesis protein CcmG/thiol:disulfide interchange protein DsbE
MYRMIKDRVRLTTGFLLLGWLAMAACTGPNESGLPNSYGWTLGNSRGVISDYHGKVVVLDFYATWCEPCREETPHLVELQQRYGQQGLQVIGLNVGGEDDRTEVPKYAKEFGIQYPLVFPDDDTAAHYLGDDESIPQAFVLDRNGRTLKRFVGFNQGVAKEVERVVQTALADH